MGLGGGGESGERASQHKNKLQDRKSNGVRQKNKTADSKLESNDSPEIPERGEDIRPP